MSELPRLIHALAEDARKLGISEDIGLRLQLVVEELFTNTVAHGFGGDDDSTVDCRITEAPSGVLLRYADSAPAYDVNGTPDRTASEELIGGLGITLIRGFSQHVHYTRTNDQNVCEILI